MKWLSNNWFKVIVAGGVVILSFSVFYHYVVLPTKSKNKESKVEDCIAELSRDPLSIPDAEYNYDYRIECAKLLDGKGISY